MGAIPGGPSTAHLGLGMPARGLFAGDTSFPTYLRLSSELQSVSPWKTVFSETAG